MKKALIIINAFACGEGQTNKISRLTEEFGVLGVTMDVRSNVDTVCISNNEIVTNFRGYDFVIYLDKDKHIAEMIERAGYTVFNSSQSLILSDDKMCTYITLANNGINIPKTIISPLNYSVEYDCQPFLDYVCSQLSFPIIVKQCFGSLGAQVWLINDRQQLESKYHLLRGLPHIYQQFISTSKGRDTRVILVNKKVVAYMQRYNANDFRSNIETGGQGSVCELPDSYRAMAEKCATILNMDYCGIDILSGENGRPVLCEVNGNAFFKGIESVTGINVASIYARHIYDTIYGKDNNSKCASNNDNK
ncbi:MAG: RimK family alpha-L-glutamate ligase [Clostridia bacterium]|nr:RimK family alpha-L-glutamate ligase [Clostridia bacterium]